jgi:hypothetical protein
MAAQNNMGNKQVGRDFKRASKHDLKVRPVSWINISDSWAKGIRKSDYKLISLQYKVGQLSYYFDLTLDEVWIRRGYQRELDITHLFVILPLNAMSAAERLMKIVLDE